MARTKLSRKWCIAIAVAVTVIILAIVIPLAVILPRRNKQTATVLLPLYIYPEDNSTWAPLYDAVEARPELKFIVIINPSSGPGDSEFPDERYTTELNKLAEYPNVEPVGYVRTGYASRDINDVLSEVAVYANWASRSSALTMQGIFFDEAPHQESAEAVEFMRTANEAVKSADGLEGDKTVIHNPGVIPHPSFNIENTDITVVFEQSYPEYRRLETSLAALTEGRSRYSYMVNAVPSMGMDDLRAFVKSLSDRAEFLFITELDTNFYESFGNIWSDFVEAMPA